MPFGRQRTLPLVARFADEWNGVFIGARRVKHHRLNDGDVIILGEHKLVYRDFRARSGSNVVPIGERSARLEEKAGSAEAD